MKWFKKLSSGVQKTSSNLTGKMKEVFKNKKIDVDTLDNLEEMLLASDVSYLAASEIIARFSKHKFAEEATIEDITLQLSDDIAKVLKPYEAELRFAEHRPHIILVCGVNGNGKTTTIGKLAHKYIAEGKKVAIAACDTFRAAAVEQLEVWSGRTKAEFIKGDLNADPASVAYKAVEFAMANSVDVLFIDTAGRLHNNDNLMAELAKIERTIKKILPDAPHDTILTLDATTGQNASIQVEYFNKLLKISGLVVTKLDGTARAGVLLSIAVKYKLPIYYIGVGEGIGDLDRFNSIEFSRALLGLDSDLK